jgi:hypothetical protein
MNSPMSYQKINRSAIFSKKDKLSDIQNNAEKHKNKWKKKSKTAISRYLHSLKGKGRMSEKSTSRNGEPANNSMLVYSKTAIPSPKKAKKEDPKEI